jgi:hypothetical protein
MRSESDESKYLEDAFDVLRFRRRGVVSFRRFVVLYAGSAETANALRIGEDATQPLRVLHR